MVMSPVGARCRTCAQVKRFAIGLKPSELVKSIAYGIGLSAIGTIVVTFIPFLGLFGYAAVGFGVGEVVSIGANRKRVQVLAPIAVACLFIGYFVGGIALLVSRGAPLSVAIGLQVASLFSLSIVGLLIGALLAWMRVR
jgi:hypothetical protein